MRCHRKIPHISHKDHVTNEEVHAKIQQEMGPHGDLLTIVKRGKLKLYGHVSHSCLAENILQGMVKGLEEDKADSYNWWGLRYNWWGFQAWDTPQDSTGNSSIDKAETNLDWQEYFCQLQDMTDALPCHIHLPVCLWIMDPHSRAPKKNTSHGNEVLPQDTTHLIQRPYYQRGSPCQDPACNRTTWRSPDDR